MRACPKCGYVDPYWWHVSYPSTVHSYSYFHELSFNDLELWEQLKDLKRGETVKIGTYVYWKSTRSDTVRRCWIEDYEMAGKKGPWKEHVDHSPQMKLTEF